MIKINGLIDYQRKLIDEMLLKLIESFKIGEVTLLEEATNSTQVSSVR